jgi:hypothetical protein
LDLFEEIFGVIVGGCEFVSDAHKIVLHACYCLLDVSLGGGDVGLESGLFEFPLQASVVEDVWWQVPTLLL